MNTVLIFAHECAPYHRPQSTIGAQRPAQFAKYLPEFGWRAIVICCDKDRRATHQRADLPAIYHETAMRLAEADNAPSLIIPTPSLAHDGWLDRAWQMCRTRPQIRRVLTAAKFRRGDWSQSWQPCARAAAAAVADKTPVDVCLAEHSPDAGLFLARWFAAQYHLPWVADLRDPLLRPFRGLARRVYARVARHLLKTATGTIAVTPVWAEMDAELLRKKVWCIPNGYDPAEFTPVAQARNERFTIAFAGNIRDTFDIFLDGLKLTREQLGAENFASLRFRYMGVAHEQVRAQALQAGLRETVETQPHGDRVAALKLVQDSDLLLLLTLPETSRSDPYLARGLYPGKLFEYWGARRPVLCVPSDGGLLDDLLHRSGTGVAFSQPLEVANYLRAAFFQWRESKALPYLPDETVLAGFTRPALAQQLARLLDTVMSPGIPDERSD